VDFNNKRRRCPNQGEENQRNRAETTPSADKQEGQMVRKTTKIQSQNFDAARFSARDCD